MGSIVQWGLKAALELFVNIHVADWGWGMTVMPKIMLERRRSLILIKSFKHNGYVMLRIFMLLNILNDLWRAQSHLFYMLLQLN